MGKKSLIRQLYPGYLAVTLVAVLAVTAYCSHVFRQVYRDQVCEELSHLADFAADEVKLVLAREGPDRLDALCKQLGRMGAGRIRLTVVAPSGNVLGDSDENPAAMEDHAGRPEIRQALQKGTGSCVRFSPTLGTRMMYVARAVGENEAPESATPHPAEIGPPPAPAVAPGSAEGPVAVVRAAAPLTQMDEALRSLYVPVAWAGLVIAAGAAGLSLLIARRISRPIVAIEQVAERFAAGELNLRVPLPDSTELAALARSLNQMAAQLGERITTITEQRNELNAVLSSMAEGVLAVDNKGRMVSLNPAAARLLGIDPAQVQGQHLEDIVRNGDFQEFVRQALAGIQPDEADITLPIDGGGDAHRSLGLHAACLTDARGRRNGAVIVLNDLTRIRKLEAIRRDFVANVSHELKTPVTSIQGFVEALVDGGVRDPAQLERYLGIIARHAARLNAIIDDLLTLSRLEEAGEGPLRGVQGMGGLQQRALRFDISPLGPVLEEAIDLARVKAEEKGITIDPAWAGQIEARINPPLLEQAVLNLIDNAVKYSPEGSRIRVEARRDDAEVSIAVLDEGCGIPPEHLSRIFERFYVVDKSRSRKLGGTGLGLAIVKHIAQAHGGRVTVRSTPGHGSTFTLHLPV